MPRVAVIAENFALVIASLYTDAIHKTQGATPLDSAT